VVDLQPLFFQKTTQPSSGSDRASQVTRSEPLDWLRLPSSFNNLIILCLIFHFMLAFHTHLALLFLKQTDTNRLTRTEICKKSISGVLFAPMQELAPWG
jgi:hypothetical protein